MGDLILGKSFSLYKLTLINFRLSAARFSYILLSLKRAVWAIDGMGERF